MSKALEIAQERLAKGEISEAEFDSIASKISGSKAVKNKSLPIHTKRIIFGTILVCSAIAGSWFYYQSLPPIKAKGYPLEVYKRCINTGQSHFYCGCLSDVIVKMEKTFKLKYPGKPLGVNFKNNSHIAATLKCLIYGKAYLNKK